jgi:hypothetical protein
MSDPVVFMIEEGEFGLRSSDKAAVGYLETPPQAGRVSTS